MLRPQNETELVELVRGTRDPLSIIGGGTRGYASAGTPVTVAEMSGITLYEPGALTLVVRAGTPMAEVEAELSKSGQRLAFEPMDHRVLLAGAGTPTIGGVASANVSGPRRIQSGACRDAMLGVRFVDGNGAIVSNGGRVMKNVTGYDLVKLLSGSCGTLGILTEISFKVLPVPEAVATVALDGLAPTEAVAALAQALGSPYDISGAAHVAGRSLVRVEGFSDSVAYRAKSIAALWSEHGPVAIERDPVQVQQTWRAVRDVDAFAGRPGDVWRLSLKPSDGPIAVGRFKNAEALFDWGGGLVWLLTPQGTDVRPALADLPGHATLVRGSGALAKFEPEPAPVAAISRALRQKFDPRGILNRGLMEAVDGALV